MNAPWRTGRSLGRTLYKRVYTDAASKDDRFLGIMDTPELAEQVVNAVNSLERVRALHAPELRGPDNTAYCRTCGTMAPCTTRKSLEGQ